MIDVYMIENWVSYRDESDDEHFCLNDFHDMVAQLMTWILQVLLTGFRDFDSNTVMHPGYPWSMKKGHPSKCPFPVSNGIPASDTVWTSAACYAHNSQY